MSICDHFAGMSRIWVAALCLLGAGAVQGAEVGVAKHTDPMYVAPASNEGELAIKQFKVYPGLKVDLFAAEPLLANPVSFAIDQQGRFYVAETFRHGNGVLDIRGRKGWEDPDILKKLGDQVVEDYMLDEELANQTTADSEALLRRHFRGRVDQLIGVSERVQMIQDSNGDGKADQATVFADGFNTIVSGIGAGLLARDGKVWYTCIPDLWMLQDTKGTGTADIKKPLLHGFGVRVGFLGHDLHGLRMGPDGKLYFSIGDRGANVKNLEGKTVANTEMGAIYRCNPDGTDFEIFHNGLRNPQELVFDEYGNLWTGDNNSDGGDPARWVYAAEGADSGWRVGYQFIESQPWTNRRGPWLGERMCYPQWDGQAEFITPPVDIIGNGPSGLTYYPGIGLPDTFKGHFFLCDFKGSPPNSGVHTFSVKPKGASFETVNKEHFIWNILATDVDFGYDGSVYVSDWVEGWSKTGKGRLYRIFDAEKYNKDPLVTSTKQLFFDGFSKRPVAELVKLLEHPDMRARQEAQFALADKGSSSIKPLAEVAAKNENQLARIHAIWGLGQIGRKSNSAYEPLLALLNDTDAEIRSQAAKVLGDGHVVKAQKALIKQLTDASPRARYFAALSLSKLGSKEALPAVYAMLRAAEDTDPWLRHAGVSAMVGAKDVNAIISAGKDESMAVRMAAVIALRRLERPEIANFLQDKEPKIVLEAARAIIDLPINGALPQLAALASQTNLSASLARRVLDANFRLGNAEGAKALANYAALTSGPEGQRIEALYELSNWAKPPGRDIVTGLWRPLPQRDGKAAAEAAQPVLGAILRSAPVNVQVEAAVLAGKLNLRELGPVLAELVKDTSANSKARVAALTALADLKDAALPEVVKLVLTDKSEGVRKEATRLQAQIKPGDATGQLASVLEHGTTGEKQGALATLATVEGSSADALIGQWMDQLLDGKVARELQLDVLEAAGKRSSADLKAKLAKYTASVPANNIMARFKECLAGGNAESGKKIFYERAEASCFRCHQIKGEGGDVGPHLDGIGGRQPREYLLESIVDPNAKIAPGFDSVIVTLKNGTTLAGVLKSESDQELVVNSPEDGLMKVKKADIQKRERGLSGMLPELANVLSKRDLRDLVEFLASQK